ncbi:alpha/beta hydrolase [Mycobacteroides abscessus]|uniref:Predicted hydrolase of the alpha/beta superfamily n=3 Tax=Mycobacteroides abscessus TaxID=36809 RepID=A0AB38D2Y7_9MYCO|nr:alpha/beta hydrolase-fold protein [Mycobacteroides abscessus]ARQ64720.1 hypothetical protein CAK77_11900 [Mycobacteroides abscessus subsp. massiliense]AWG65218.1 hypothetical protein DDT46_16385 [Mycobacteroides abscessus]MBE5404467.1 hypothetical protein [Mycobacteroides abscessus]MBE5419455.1 hypothetical protein [Mycobacteroides abscessus]MBE5430846.1 hypothetical protein [Mycobacteroides abscessus]
MPPTTPTPPPAPTPIPQLPANDFHQYSHGVSALGGWFPIAVQVLAVVVLLVVIGWRSRRWRLLWVPVSVAFGALGALAAWMYMNSEGLASDPAPFRLWLWIGVFATSVAVAAVGFRSARWWRRGVSLLAIPLTLLAALVALNTWVGYYPTVQAAWGAISAGPLPNEVDMSDLAGLRNSNPATGKLVPVDIPADASGFKHRGEYVYLPPAWFAGETPPRLPVVMMIAGEFNTPADWVRTGNATKMIDDYAASHAGQAPIFVFVDVAGSFNNDTECVNGPRGNAASHLTEDVRPYVVSEFDSSPDPANWAVVGWSMGGTCAVDLTVMHPDLFSTFVDIAGDHGPTAGTKQQTIDRLYGGDAAQWDAFDPRTVMAKHGPYTGVTGWFEDAIPPADAKKPSGPKRPTADTPTGIGGHDDVTDDDREGAAQDLCAAAQRVQISCSIHQMISGHTWQFASRTFSDALPWLAAQIRTPGATG